MNKLVLILLTFASTGVSAAIQCNTRYVEQWPMNPVVTVTEKGDSQYEVLIERSYYGYINEESYSAISAERRDGRIILVNKDNELTLDPQEGKDGKFPAILLSNEYGQHNLICKNK